MRDFILLWFCTLLGVCASASAPSFDPSGYQHPDGAIPLHYRGDYIEPYFATKALLLAQESGLDVHDSARRWIEWLLPRQDKHGSFGRYSRKPGEDWRLSSAADADDSMLALWLELLYTNAPDSGIPKQWQDSVRRARSGLDALRNGRLGVYHVSRQNHVALLMDNVEVYSALESIANAQERFGQLQEAQATHKQAESLDFHIQQVFWNKHAEWFRPSIQKSKPGFYPDVVAQVYPWLADMHIDSRLPLREEWMKWKDRFANDWLDKKFDPHPWGLVAVAAVKLGDSDSAACWLSRSEPLRFSSNWNVLEEAAFQVVETKIAEGSKTSALACSKVASGE